MLTHTFCHIPGVGPKTEMGLWRRGIRTWADYRDALARGGKAATLADDWLARSQAALAEADAELARWTDRAVDAQELAEVFARR